MRRAIKRGLIVALGVIMNNRDHRKMMIIDGKTVFSGGMNLADEYINLEHPYGETPLDNEIVGENVYLNIINQAQKYVYIMTPYLIIDTDMINSLILAAKRGVDVRIVVPGIPDKKIVYSLTTSYFETLIKNGVKIYKYTPEFVHSKVFVSDDNIATVGSINLDYRSLFIFAFWMWSFYARCRCD